MRWVSVMAVMALAVVGACGGSDEPQAAPTTTSAPTPEPSATVNWSSACPRVQDALDEAFAGGGDDYSGFADSIETLVVDASDAEAKQMDGLVDASRNMESATDYVTAEGEWLDAMDTVSSTCELLGSPLN